MANKDYTPPTPIVLPSIKAWTYNSNTDFHKDSIRNTITEIEFVDYLPNPVNLNENNCWDVSQENDQSVIAWLDGTKLYIGGNGGLKANEDSSYIFCNLPNVTCINFNNNYDTSGVTNMSGMFAYSGNITSLDLSSFDSRNVTNMSGMFSMSGNYTETPSKLETITFGNTWDTSNVTNMSWMFDDCYSLRTIYVKNDWNTNKVVNSYECFDFCTALIGGNGTKYNSNYKDKTYAKIDTSNQKGFFTDIRQNMAENNKELEYIESTGTQYIDTGIIPKQNTEINIKFQVMNVNSSADCIIFGGEDGYNQNAFHLYRTNGNFDIGFSNQDFFGEYQSDTIYTLQLKDKSLTLNSTQSSALTGNINTPNSIYLFAVHRANIITETNCNKRIYYCKLYSEDTLIRDFIPVYNTITESYGLYDESNQKFYGNSGTGCFTGPEITKN